MTFTRKNAQLAQTINVNSNAIGDTLYIPTSGNIGINIDQPEAQLHVIGSGLFSNMVYVNGVQVSVSGHGHIISDVDTLSSVLDNKLDTDDIIEGGFF